MDTAHMPDKFAGGLSPECGEKGLMMRHRYLLIPLLILTFFFLNSGAALAFSYERLSQFANLRFVSELEKPYKNMLDETILEIAVPDPDGRNGWYTQPFYASGYVMGEVWEMDYVAIKMNDGAYVFGNLLVDQEGIIQLTAIGADIMGRRFSAKKVVKVDFTSPEISLSSQGEEGKNGWYRSAVDVEVNALDRLSGFYRLVVDITKNGDNSEARNYQNFNNFSSDFQTTLDQDGIYIIHTHAFDQAGNVHEEEWIIQIDSTPPIIIMDTPWAFSGDIRLQGSSSDEVAGVENIFINSGQGWSDTQVAGAKWQYLWKTLNKVGDGKHLIQVQAIDQAGNQSVATKTVEVLNHQWPFVALTGISLTLGLTSLCDPRLKAWEYFSRDIHMIFARKMKGEKND